jgi:hypothetical protein
MMFDGMVHEVEEHEEVRSGSPMRLSITPPLAEKFS